MKSQEEVRRLREAAGNYVSELRIPMADTRRSPDLPANFPPTSSSADSFLPEGFSESGAFLISPLPEFSSGELSTHMFSLPDVVYDAEEKPSSGKDSICDSKYHPTACRCAQAPPAPEVPYSVMATSAPIAGPSRRHESSIGDRASADRRHAIYSDSPAPSYHSHLPISRSSRPPSISRSPSRAPTRPSSPSPRPQQSLNRIVSEPATSNMNLLHAGQKVGVPRDRLHDLLQDSNSAALSSSLPNMPIHFPPAIARDTERERARNRVDSPTRSRSSSTSGHRSPLPIPHQPRETRTSTSNLPHNITAPYPPPPPLSSSYHTSNTSTRASDAAVRLEQAKLERRRAEKQKEREKSQHTRQEPDKSDREHDKAERERTGTSRGRDREKSEKMQYRPEEQPRERQTSSASSYSIAATRRDHPPVYTAPIPVPIPVPSTYSAQKGSSTTSSRSSAAALRNSYNAHKHTTNALPVLGTMKA